MNQFASVAVAHLMATQDLDRWVLHLRETYRRRRDALCGALVRHLSGYASFVKPVGGFFIWVQLEPSVKLDAVALLEKAKILGVAFQPGPRFTVDPSRHRRSFRLSFAFYDEATLEKAVAVLLRAIQG